MASCCRKSQLWLRPLFRIPRRSLTRASTVHFFSRNITTKHDPRQVTLILFQTHLHHDTDQIDQVSWMWHRIAHRGIAVKKKNKRLHFICTEYLTDIKN